MFEYLVIRRLISAAMSEIHKLLGDASRSGWRVVGCVATEGWVLWTLEREVKRDG